MQDGGIKNDTADISCCAMGDRFIVNHWDHIPYCVIYNGFKEF